MHEQVEEVRLLEREQALLGRLEPPARERRLVERRRRPSRPVSSRRRQRQASGPRCPRRGLARRATTSGTTGVPSATTSRDWFSSIVSIRRGLSTTVTLRYSSVAPGRGVANERLKRSERRDPGELRLPTAPRGRARRRPVPVSTRARSALPHEPGLAATRTKPLASIVALVGIGAGAIQADDDRLAAAVLEEVADGERERAQPREPAEASARSRRSS